MAKAKRKSARQPARKFRSKSKTKAKPRSVTVAALKRAVEGRDAQALADMYADDAVMLVIDHDNPPSSPRRLAGKAAIVSCGHRATPCANGDSAHHTARQRRPVIGAVRSKIPYTRNTRKPLFLFVLLLGFLSLVAFAT